MKRKVLPAFILLLLGTGLGSSLSCSSGDSPAPNTYPLSLALLDGHRTGNTGLFTLQVSKQGVHLHGAKINYRTSPQNVTTIVQDGAHNDLLSDTAGTFKFVINWNDTTQLVAFQSYADSLKSNFVVWP